MAMKKFSSMEDLMKEQERLIFEEDKKVFQVFKDKDKFVLGVL